VVGSFSAVFVIPSEVEESLTISGHPPVNDFRHDGKRRRRCCRPSFSVLPGVASSEASRMGRNLKLLADRKLELDMTGSVDGKVLPPGFPRD